MISKRQLIKWRKEALIHKETQSILSSGGVLGNAIESCSYIDKVLQLTQELIDIHILKESGRS